jgi:hypothetical protein
MMWLVRLALRRPISVAVMALLMLVLGTLSLFLMNILTRSTKHRARCW